MVPARLSVSAAALTILLLSACDKPAPAVAPAPAAPVAPPAPAAPKPVTPPPAVEVAPGPEAKTPQAAMALAQSYFDLIRDQKHAEARKAWGAGGEGSGMTEQAFAAQFAKYKILQAQVGAPGEPEGGAGSIYIQAPVQIQGQLTSGAPFHQVGVVTLRRVNDVPGATADQLRWRISQVDLHPNP